VKLLIFGKDGQVGRAAQRLLPRLGEVVALGRSEADFESPGSLAGIVGRVQPDVVVNCAAYTAVDAAEQDRERAFVINGEAVGALGKAAKQNGALVVHYSTDYVYPGTASGPQAETDPTGPLSVYGQSKLAGEDLLAKSGADSVILRTSWVYADEGKNFPLTILRLAREREELSVVADQIGAPTAADLIADVTAQILPQVRADKSKTGIYNLSPTGETSWYELARFLIAGAIAAGAQLKMGPDAVKAIGSRDYPTKAARPGNSRLDTSKLRAAFGLALPPWQEGVSQLVRTLVKEGRL
jgi:dTDP-4-dehydrorhamnose reductase